MKSTYELVQDGLQALMQEHADLEVTKKGILRAGNTGLCLPDGSIVGKCARQTYLRLEGIEAGEDDVSRQFMFAAGRTNEDSWTDLLIKAGIPADCIRREEEVPIKWFTKSGREVSGRPDLVIGEWPTLPAPPFRGPWTPIRGIELKLVSSLWTGRDVAVKGEPKAMHLMQAAHYSWKLDPTGRGVPFELWYTSRADFQLPYMKNVKWPEQGLKGSEFFQYKEDGSALKMIPFIVGYELGWEQDTVRFRRIGPDAAGPWVRSIITKKGIEDYFELVDSLVTTRVLPPRPQNLTATGQKGSYSICSYCPLQPVCDKKESAGLDAWVESVREWSKYIPSKGSMK